MTVTGTISKASARVLELARRTSAANRIAPASPRSPLISTLTAPLPLSSSRQPVGEWRASGLRGGRARLPAGAGLHGGVRPAGVLRGRRGRVAPGRGRPEGMPGGPECPAETAAPPDVQVPTRLPSGGTLPPGVLDRQVCRWVGREARACVSWRRVCARASP